MHPIENIMSTTLENLKQMVDVSTVIGTPVQTAFGAVIIPVSKVGFGFVSGGGEYGESVSKNNKEEERLPFAGGAGAGISVNPTGFLVICHDTIKYVPVQESSSLERAIEAVPELAKELKKVFSSQKAPENPCNTPGCFGEE